MSEQTRRGAARPLDWRLGGVLLGLLSTVAVALQGPLGVSTAYVTTEAAVAEKLAPGTVSAHPYLQSIGAALTPEWVLVLGMLLGGLLAGRLWPAASVKALPSLWQKRFGARPLVRFAAAFAGGFLLLFGARMAGGCTSGHVISGISQLALSGFVFGIGVFASAIPTALLLYGRRS